MTLTVERESSLTQALRQINQLNSRIAELEQQHISYVQGQKSLVGAIANICISPIQEIEALRILIYRGEGECRRYLRSLIKNQRRIS